MPVSIFMAKLGAGVISERSMRVEEGEQPPGPQEQAPGVGPPSPSAARFWALAADHASHRPLHAPGVLWKAVCVVCTWAGLPGPA